MSVGSRGDGPGIFRAEPTDEAARGARFFPRQEGGPIVAAPGRARATVAIAHTDERHRDHESILRLTRQAVDLLGGIGRYVRRGDSVLVKPNLTGAFLADEGMTTDPRVVAALVRLCREAGARRITVADASGMAATRKVMRATGMAAAARAAGARVVCFDECELREVDVPEGRALHRIPLPVPLLEADVVINACKGKTHHMDPVSGAIKNWVGVLPLDVRQRHHDRRTYAEYVDILAIARPALNVCDAIVVGEGDGPVATTPRWCGCVLASEDPVALDVTLCQLLSLEPSVHRFVAEAAERGLGIGDPAAIGIVGARLEDVRIEARRPRQGYDYLPVNVLVGGGVTYAGTFGHFKSIADGFLKDGTWNHVIAARGVPTFLIGDVEDPDFERHVRQGPYIVIDDAAPERYRNDPRVTFIPGHPVLHDMLPGILRGLGLTLPARAVRKGRELLRAGEARLLYVPRRRLGRALGLALAVAAAAGGGLAAALGAIAARRRREGEERLRLGLGLAALLGGTAAGLAAFRRLGRGGRPGRPLPPGGEAPRGRLRA